MAKSNSISKTLVWILMGLLFVGLAGFGATNLSGTIRSVGAVGEETISVEKYSRNLQNEIRAIQAETNQTLSFAQAQSFGLPQRTLSRLVTTAAIDNETAALGLSVSDQTVAREVMQFPAFQGPGGRFDRDTYRFTLESARLSEAEFEEDLRKETARTLLQAAIVSGIEMPKTHAARLLTFVGETRGFTWAALDESRIENAMPAPTEDDLVRYHADNIARYTLPATRDISYVWLTPEMLIDTVEIDDAALQRAFDEQSAQFNQPERRLIERLVMPDTAAAQAAIARIQSGESSFEDEVAARGLDLADTDMGDVTRQELGNAADPIFAAEDNEVLGPLTSDLGPALYRINGTLPARATSFEDAQPILREQLAQDRARRVIEAQITDIEDLLAGGATLEEVARESEMQLGQIDWTAQSDTDIAGYDTFRVAAASASVDGYPEVTELGDGGIFALRLNAVLPPETQELDAVRAQVEDDWSQSQIAAQLLEQAQALARQIGEGKTFEGLGLNAEQQTGQTRSGTLPNLPRDVLEHVFTLKTPAAIALPHDGGAIVLKLDTVDSPDMGSPENLAILSALQNQVSNSLSGDLFQALARDAQNRAGISLDQSAINAVHANFQ